MLNNTKKLKCSNSKKKKEKLIIRTIIFNHMPIKSRSSSQKLGNLLKKLFAHLGRVLYHSRKIILLVLAVVLATLIFNFLIASWVNNNANNPNNANNDVSDRTISTTGAIYVRGLEIYGGDIKSEPSGKTYIDWGELTLGSSKNVSLYVKSTSNFDVELGLNMTNLTPAGIEDYITISWDYNGTVLSPGHNPLLITLNLDVSSSREFVSYLVDNTVTAFGFDITIYASAV
jgi:hypothetical protein